MIHTSMFQKHIHKVKFYPSADDFTQAPLVMLVTNIMSAWWPNFPLKQVAPPGGQTVTAKCNCHNLNIEFCLFNHAHSENSFEQVKIDNEIVKQIALEEKKIEITK